MAKRWVQEYHCVCQGDDPWLHKHHDEAPHSCARCRECKAFRPDLTDAQALRILIGPDMTNAQAADILLGKQKQTLPAVPGFNRVLRG